MPDQKPPRGDGAAATPNSGRAQAHASIPVTVVDQNRAIPGRLLDVNSAGGSFQLPNPPPPGTDVTTLLFPPHPLSRSVWAKVRIEWSVVQGSARVMSGFGARWLAVESADLDALRSIVGPSLIAEQGAGRVEVVPAVTYSGKLYRFRPAATQRTVDVPPPPEPPPLPDDVEAEAVLLPATLALAPDNPLANDQRWPAMVLAVTPERVWVAVSPDAMEGVDERGLELRTAFTTTTGLHDVVLRTGAVVNTADPSGLAVLELVEQAADAAESAAADAYQEFVRYLRATASNGANHTSLS